MAAAPTIGPDELRHALRLALDVLRRAPADRWGEPAGDLDWTCWETAEHLADDLFAYAAQLGPSPPPAHRELPLLWEARRPGGPANAIHADPAAGPDGLLAVLEACGALLVAVVASAPPDRRAHHVFGAAGPEGFAAMGVVEVLVHTHDLARGLGLAWQPPDELCRFALARLFPDVSAGTPPWPTLLWATGRGELDGRSRRTTWRWYGGPPPGQ